MAHEPQVCAEVDKLVSLAAEETKLRTRKNEAAAAPIGARATASQGKVAAVVAFTPSAVAVPAEKNSESIMQVRIRIVTYVVPEVLGACRVRKHLLHPESDIINTYILMMQEVVNEARAKPFAQCNVNEVCRLVQSIDGVGFAEAASAIKANGIDGEVFLQLLRNNDVDLTTSIEEGGLGFKRLQLKVVHAKIDKVRLLKAGRTKAMLILLGAVQALRSLQTIDPPRNSRKSTSFRRCCRVAIYIKYGECILYISCYITLVNALYCRKF
jgi:hypothetical protein